jgi:hypothetical protein
MVVLCLSGTESVTLYFRLVLLVNHAEVSKNEM